MALINRNRYWLALAAVLGVAGALLFTDAQGNLLPEWGPNLLVWVMVALGALALMARHAGVKLDGDGRWLALPLCFFAASFFLREDPFLRFWNGVLMLVSAALLATRCRGPWRASVAGYTEYIRLCALAAVYSVCLPFSLLRKLTTSSGAAEVSGGSPPRVVMPNSRLGVSARPLLWSARRSYPSSLFRRRERRINSRHRHLPLLLLPLLLRRRCRGRGC